MINIKKLKIKKYLVISLIFISILYICGCVNLTYATDDNESTDTTLIKSIEISNSDKYIFENKKVSLDTKVSPSNYTEKILYKSSDTSILTISSDGTMTPKKAGKVTVTAYSESKKVSVKKTFYVIPQETDNTYKKSITIGKGESYTYSELTTNVSSATNYYTTSGIASFNKELKRVTGKSVGTTTIYVVKDKKLAAILKVTVKKAPTSIKLSKKSVKMGKSEKITLEFTLSSNSASKSITYSSSNKSVATVNSKGVITAKKKGTAKITVKTYNNKTYTCTVKVGDKPTSISVNYSSVKMGVGEKVTLGTTVNGGYSQTITYSSSNKSVATVSSKGVITAKKAGSAIITCKTYNGKKVTCTITVKKAPTASGFAITNTNNKVQKGSSKYKIKYSMGGSRIICKKL